MNAVYTPSLFCDIYERESTLRKIFTLSPPRPTNGKQQIVEERKQTLASYPQAPRPQCGSLDSSILLTFDRSILQVLEVVPLLLMSRQSLVLQEQHMELDLTMNARGEKTEDSNKPFGAL